MRYGKMLNGEVVYHGLNSPIVNPNGSKTITKKEERLREAGYMPVIDTPPPAVEDGYKVVGSWIEQDEQIVKVWETHEIDDTDISADDILAMLEEVL